MVLKSFLFFFIYTVTFSFLGESWGCLLKEGPERRLKMIGLFSKATPKGRF